MTCIKCVCPMYAYTLPYSILSVHDCIPCLCTTTSVYSMCMCPCMCTIPMHVCINVCVYVRLAIKLLHYT